MLSLNSKTLAFKHFILLIAITFLEKIAGVLEHLFTLHVHFSPHQSTYGVEERKKLHEILC